MFIPVSVLINVRVCQTLSQRETDVTHRRPQFVTVSFSRVITVRVMSYVLWLVLIECVSRSLVITQL